MDIDLDLTTDAASANDNGADVFDCVPELPSAQGRWSARRKAAVIEAIRGGWVPVEEVCRLYSLSPDEILSWERTIDQRGVAALHIKQLQINRYVRGRS
jgi:hypothetical protein